MLEWISENIGTIFISLLLILMVTGIIRTLIKDKKQGRSSCGGNCAHCKMCAACHSRQPRKTGT
ncbi:MAG: FeoB-associated Cys-rich membrane protein [Lachnospiraceae bacterium]|nr:FeoB-associated Cys-rich membrane protein [Lachnospiraceae bacterium]